MNMPELIHRFPVPHKHYFGERTKHSLGDICQCDCGQYGILIQTSGLGTFEVISDRHARRLIKKNAIPRFVYRD